MRFVIALVVTITIMFALVMDFVCLLINRSMGKVTPEGVHFVQITVWVASIAGSLIGSLVMSVPIRKVGTYRLTVALGAVIGSAIGIALTNRMDYRFPADWFLTASPAVLALSLVGGFLGALIRGET